MSTVVTETGHLHSDEGTTTATVGFQNQYYSSGGVSEIEEEDSSELFEINHGEPLASIREEFEGSLFSVDIQNGDDMVYVAVGKSESSMDALVWAVKHAVNPSSLVYLIHVFPEVRHIPTPLGKLPKSQVSPEQVENYMAQERGKRRDLLQKFLNMCSASKVKVDTILIESDMVGKAILDLIPILNIKRLVVGTTKSSGRKLRSRRGSGIADQILQSAPDCCDVKIICERKEVLFDQVTGSPSPSLSPSPSPRGSKDNSKFTQQEERSDSISCCFKPKFL